MVYGLNVVPEGSYRIDIELLDEQLNPVRMEDTLYKVKAIDQGWDGGVNWTAKTSGKPVDGTMFPKHVIWKSATTAVADFDLTLDLTVSERAKSVIERIEPGVHQFFPVEYLDPKKQHLENRYWMVICNRIDSIDRDHTTMVLYKGKVWRPAAHLVRRGEEIPAHIDPKATPRTVFSLKTIGDRHFWHDKHLDSGAVWLSDEAKRQVEVAGLTGVRFSENGMESI